MDEKNPLNPDQLEHLDRVSTAGKHLLQLINEVLDLSKIEAGQIEITHEPADLVPIVKNVIAFSKPLADQNDVTLEFQEGPDKNVIVEVDKLRFMEIVINLISNAIKYNKPQGSVTISFEKQKGDKIRLGIRDTGHGIPDDKKDLLFKPFERFDAEAEMIEGTGIGLTISKHFIEMLEGTIGFESKFGEGSFFYVDLPLSKKTILPVPAEKPLDSFTDPSVHGNGKRKVLYIEDIQANIELMGQIISYRSNIELISASNALDGIEMAQSENPDLILMDIHMPGMDGLTAFKKLQTIKKTQTIPVIALTADAMDSDIKKGLELGFADYITKPIEVARFWISWIRF